MYIVVSDKNSVRSVFKQIDQMGEKIDLCFNFAGISKLTPIFKQEEDEDFELLIKINLMGAWYLTKEVANHMKKHDINGSIINVSSINGVNKVRENIAGYSVSKAGIIQLTRALVAELSRFNIRINCIVPGLFDTPLTHHKLKTPEQRRKMQQRIPTHLIAEPKELDGLVLYLASDKALRYLMFYVLQQIKIYLD